MNYDKIVSLIRHWEAYEAEHADGDMAGFARWILEKSPVEEKPEEEASAAEVQTVLQLPATFTREIPLNGRIARLFQRLYKFGAFYSKKALGELDIRNVEDFNYLATLYRAGNPRKSDLIQYNLSEFTSGIEVIKRLVRMDLVEEYEDPDDRRSRRLKITPKGEKVLFQCFPKMSQVGEVLFKGVSHERKEQLLSILEPMDEQHTATLPKFRDASIEAIHNWGK